jgi:hypothetical protein
METKAYPYELRLPLAPYRFEWADEPAADCQTRQTAAFSEERYTHLDGSVVVIRNYPADGSFHVMSDRGEIELIDHSTDVRSPYSVSIVKLP